MDTFHLYQSLRGLSLMSSAPPPLPPASPLSVSLASVHVTTPDADSTLLTTHAVAAPLLTLSGSLKHYLSSMIPLFSHPILYNMLSIASRHPHAPQILDRPLCLPASSNALPLPLHAAGPGERSLLPRALLSDL